MSVENRHETAEPPESREQNLEQEHSGNRESRLSDSDLDKVDDKSDNLATDNLSDGHEKDANKNTDKEVSDVSQDEPAPSLEADQQNEKEQIAEEFPEPTDTPEVNNELSNAADASDNRTDVADNERTKHEDICDVDNIDNKVETSSASEGKDGVPDEAKDLEDAKLTNTKEASSESDKQNEKEETAADIKDVQKDSNTETESNSNIDDSSISDGKDDKPSDVQDEAKDAPSKSGAENNTDNSKGREGDNSVKSETDTNSNKSDAPGDNEKDSVPSKLESNEGIDSKDDASTSNDLEAENENHDDSENPENESKEDATDNNNPEDKTNNDYVLTPEQQETHAELESIAREYLDKEPLTAEDKQELSDRQYEYLSSRNPEDRNDCRVPTPESIKNVYAEDGHVYIQQNWKPGTDGAVNGTRHMEVIPEGTTIDRLYEPNGKYFSPLDENGNAYSENQRAVGTKSTEGPITENSCYHQYEVKKDLTRENFEAALKETYTDQELKEMQNKLEAYYMDCADSDGDYHPDDPYIKPTDEQKDGVKSGEIDKMFRDDDGGGKQYIMPFNATEMCEMGLLNRIK